jgi:hypothetical protein
VYDGIISHADRAELDQPRSSDIKPGRFRVDDDGIQGNEWCRMRLIRHDKEVPTS